MDENTQDVSILRHYHNAGLKLVCLEANTKKAVKPKWQEHETPLEEVEEWVAGGGAVGWQMGEVSGWISGIDCDWEETRRMAPRFLPETLQGAKGQENASQYIYRSPGLGFQTFKGLDDSEILSVKASSNGRGHQMVVPPSTHAKKGPYHFNGRGFNPAAIAEVEADVLETRVGMLATAALISRVLPERGRHDFAMALSGYLLRNGEAAEDVTKMLVAAWEDQSAPREGIRDVENIVRDTQAKLSNNEPVTGGRRLEELRPGLPRKIGKFLDWQRTDMREQRRHYMRTDLGNAERFVDLHRDRVRWCPDGKSFLIWDGRRWAWDKSGEVEKLAHETARGILNEAALAEDKEEQKKIATFAIASQNTTRLKAMLTEAKPYLAVRMGELDADQWLLNCKNGTLDLKTGKLKDHDPHDRITKLAPVQYDPEAECPRFERFLTETLGDDAVITFMKRFAGYTLTGVTRERVFAILYGSGKNGKSTLVELLQDALGDYATNTDTETILAKRYQGIGNDVAALKGARFVSAAEVEKGRRLAESKVKQLTGSDTVTARFLFGEPFNFRPEFKLWMSTNYKPEIRGTDDAIWDRIRLVPFTKRFEGDKADPKLPDALRGELPGVLAWMTEGCLEWQEHGLGEPESVRTATEQYRTEMDTLAAFIDECCVVDGCATAPATRLYERYKSWADEAGEKRETQKTFGMRLSDRGFTSFTYTSGPLKKRKGWEGIGLRVDDGGPDHPPYDPPRGPSGEDDRPPGGEMVDDRPPGEPPLSMPYSPRGGEAVDDGGPFFQHLPLVQPRVRKDVEKRSTSSTSSTNSMHNPSSGSHRRTLTEEEAREVQRLIGQGMAAKFALAEVLGEEGV
jgi:putative DNA primase/helicase